MKQHLPTLTDDEALEYLLKEIKTILPIMVKNQKSYLYYGIIESGL